MRPHGRAQISRTHPRALGVCQRCGFLYNHDQLRWQYEYGGMRLINLRFLACETCYDTPQVQLRTILIPPDPVPIEYPLPEAYTTTDNPLSPIGYSPQANFVAPNSQLMGANIGTLTLGGGLNSAFDGTIPKGFAQSAIGVGANTYTLGKAWNQPISGNAPLSLTTPVTYNVSSFALYGSFNAGFGLSLPDFSPDFSKTDFDVLAAYTTPINIQLQGSNDQVTWTTLFNTVSSTAVGQVITSSGSILAGGNFQNHRFVFSVPGSSASIATVSVAQAQLNVSNTGQNEQ